MDKIKDIEKFCDDFMKNIWASLKNLTPSLFIYHSEESSVSLISFIKNMISLFCIQYGKLMNFSKNSQNRNRIFI